jgi:tRNA pseudouridine38-40 synthase
VERNYKLLIAYDGTDFHGWQKQPGLRTVQGDIEHAIARVVNHRVDLRGAGRTDSGVHAVGQVANLRTTCPIPPENLRKAIGSRLAEDVAILDLHEVHADFVASASATSKLYRYCIHNHTNRPVAHLRQRYVYHCWRPLDEGRMQEAARHFLGTHDFSAMASAGCDKVSKVRTIFRCDVYRSGDEVVIDVEGSGFLYHQVRNMAGTLVEVGRGHWPPERVPEILASKQRAMAGPTLPARGLCMQWVRYPEHLLRPAVTEEPPPEPLPEGTA